MHFHSANRDLRNLVPIRRLTVFSLVLDILRSLDFSKIDWSEACKVNVSTVPHGIR
jgi:hypothetical protein